MKKIYFHFLFFIFVLQVQSATLVTLTAKQATGGALIKTNLNDSAVYFPTANPANDRIVWTVPGTLPAGLYQLDIDFYQASGSSFSVNEYISFEAAGATQLGLLDFYYLSVSSGTYTKSIGFYSPNVLSNIALIKSSQRNLPTFGIRAIRISAGTEAAMASKQFVFQLPVSGTQITPPFSLPTGMYVVNSTVAIATSWNETNGSTITTPSSKSNRIYLDQAAQPAIFSGGPVSNITINHYPPVASPNMSAAGVAPLLPTADTTVIETRTLKLIGYTGSELPQLDIFPGGKKVAVVSSWDDGQLADLQLVDTLCQYGMKGSFMMIASTSAMIPQMNVLEAKGMEIGSHSWSHPAFYTSSPQRCLDEAIESRRFLESKLGHPVISFAYPYDYTSAYDVNGDYVLGSIRSAGYWFGRSTGTGFTLGTVDGMSEPLAMKPTSHFNVSVSTIKSLLDAKLLIPGSVFHLWGHSYEIAGTGMAGLRSTLKVLANNPSVWYATLGELMLWKYTRKQLVIEPDLTAVGDKTFTLKMPWLHPYLRKVPVSLIVPAGVSEVEWQGVKFPVVNSKVQLMWNLQTQTNVENPVLSDKFQLSTKQNQLDVKNITDGQEVVIYNLSGKEVSKQFAESSSTVSFELASGVYVVRVGTESGKVIIY